MCLHSFNNSTTIVDCAKNVARRKKNGNRYHSKVLLNKLDCFRLLYRTTLVTCSCVVRRLAEVLFADARDDDDRRDNRRKIRRYSWTESVGGGTRKGVESRVSLIRHFIMSFTLFLRVRNHRQCLDVCDDGIGDALDNDDGQKVYL